MYLKCHYLLSCIFVPNFAIDGAKLLKMLVCDSINIDTSVKKSCSFLLSYRCTVYRIDHLVAASNKYKYISPGLTSLQNSIHIGHYD